MHILNYNLVLRQVNSYPARDLMRKIALPSVAKFKDPENNTMNIFSRLIWAQLISL